MIASVLLLMIGTADVVRSTTVVNHTAVDHHAAVDDRTTASARSRTSRWCTSRRVAAAAPVVAAAVLLLGSVVLLGLPAQWAPLCLAVAVAWIILMPATKDDEATDSKPLRLWPALTLVALLATVAAFDSTTVSGTQMLTDLVETSPRTLLAGVSADTVLAGAAVAVALTQTANLVVRAALGRNRPRHQPTSSAPGAPTATTTTGASAARWTLRIRGRSVGSVHRDSRTEDAGRRETNGPGPTPPDHAAAATPDTSGSSRTSGTTMRGGRHIGPIERLLLVGAVLAGAYPVVAGLFAAKGIVRFPEIADDSSSGGKAEEFLVGSMTSWLIAGLGAGYLTLVSAG